MSSSAFCSSKIVKYTIYFAIPINPLFLKVQKEKKFYLGNIGLVSALLINSLSYSK